MDRQFQYFEGEVCAATLCLDLTLYVKDPFPDIGEGVVEFYNQFIDRFGKSIRWYATESMGTMAPISPRALSMVPSWFKPSSKPRSEYGMFMHSGQTKEGVGDVAFDMFGDRDSSYTNFLRMAVPASYTDNGVQPFLDLVTGAASKLPFLSGHGGYAFILDTRGRFEGKALRKIKEWVPRHPGIDIGKPLSTSWYTLDAIKGVNWLTLLNQDFCKRLGGVESIKTKLGPEAVVHPVQNGILIQAGPKPQMGDVNKGENLPVYRNVAKVVHPVRLKEHRPIGWMNEEATMAWFGRFDG